MGSKAEAIEPTAETATEAWTFVKSDICTSPVEHFDWKYRRHWPGISAPKRTALSVTGLWTCGLSLESRLSQREGLAGTREGIWVLGCCLGNTPGLLSLGSWNQESSGFPLGIPSPKIASPLERGRGHVSLLLGCLTWGSPPTRPSQVYSSLLQGPCQGGRSTLLPKNPSAPQGLDWADFLMSLFSKLWPTLVNCLLNFGCWGVPKFKWWRICVFRGASPLSQG